MKLGFLTAAFPDLTLEQVASWAASEGFRDARDRLLAGGRRRATALREHHAHRVDSFDPDAVHELLGAHGLEISALAYYPNNLHPDAAHREEVNAHLRKVVDAAQALGVSVVGTFAGNDQTKSPPDNLRALPDELAHDHRRRAA